MYNYIALINEKFDIYSNIFLRDYYYYYYYTSNLICSENKGLSRQYYDSYLSLVF